MMLRRTIEELFPVFIYCLNRLKIKGIIEFLQREFDNKDYESYLGLDEAILEDRIKEEHKRATSIDDKSVKLTVGFAIGSAALSISSTQLIKMMKNEILIIVCMVAVIIAVFYTLIGGWIALGGLRTSSIYGYGTKFISDVKSSDNSKHLYVQALVLQEKANILRHLRNESSYQNLRNGILCLFIAFILFVTDIGIQQFVA